MVTCFVTGGLDRVTLWSREESDPYKSFLAYNFKTYVKEGFWNFK